MFVLAFWLAPPQAAQAQVRKKLESKRQKLLEDIRQTTNLLNQTTRNRSSALDRYQALERQIEAREELVLTLKEELVQTDLSIQRNTAVVDALGQDVARLEQEYGRMARQALRQKMSSTKLLFLFSSQNVNQLFRRWQYLRQYERQRQRQARMVIDTRQSLLEKITLLEDRKAEKEHLIETEAEHQLILAEERDAKAQLLKSLQADEDRLKDELSRQRLAHERLNQAIEKVIKNEIIAMRKRARTPKGINKSPGRSSRNEKLTGSFGSNRGRLPWPVNGGVVSRRFGQQSHPTLRKIEIANNGIDIRTDQRAKVQAVFEGRVVGTQYVPGYQNMLIVKHGEYYTVYSNLEQVYVKKDQWVKARQAVGRLAVDPKSNKSEVHFELWRDKKRLNPIHWLARR